MNKRLLYVVIFLGGSYFATSQNSVVKDIWNDNEIEDTIQLHKAYKYLRHLTAIKSSDSALIFSKKVIQAARVHQDFSIMGNAYVDQGDSYSELNKYFFASQSYEKAISIFKKIGCKQRLAKVFKDLYFIEYYRDNLTKAADYLIESRTYYEQIKDTLGLSKVNNYLGDLYAKLDNFELAEDYYQKSIKLKNAINHTKGIGLTMNNLSYLYINHKMSKKAKNIVEAALKINKSDSLPIYTIYSYYILAKIALHHKEYKISEKYYDTVLGLGSKTKSFALTIPLIISKQQMAVIALETKEYQKADDLLKIARKEFKALKDIDPTTHLLSNYEISAKLDSARGRIYQVLAWQKKYQRLSDEKRMKLSSGKIKRAEERHSAEIEHLKMMDDQKEKERQNSIKIFRYKTFALVSICILLIISAFLFVIVQTRKDRKRLIKELNESNDVKNKLFSIISHDLKNEITGLEGSLNLLKENSISENEFKEIIPLLANGTHQTSILLHNLLNWSKSQLKELNANPTPFDITEVIDDKFAFFQQKAKQKDIELINNLDATLIYADKDMFGIVAQNLIANAIKFCNPGDSIALLSKDKGSHYEICFKDTGIGIDPIFVDKLFAEDTFTTRGTQNETGTGLGLRICKELIELNQGEIAVESVLGTGSIFSISLPKAA